MLLLLLLEQFTDLHYAASTMPNCWPRDLQNWLFLNSLHVQTKKWNRRYEFVLRNVEISSSLALVLSRKEKQGFDYQSSELTRLWKIVLLSQFHDVLPGTSINVVCIFQVLLKQIVNYLLLSQHTSYDDCLEVKREYYQNCFVLDCVTQCLQSAAHLYEQFLQVQQIGFVTLEPLRHA